MSARDVADMLAVAQEGLTVATQRSDAHLRRQSMELVTAALTHRDAPAFFAGLQVALAETYEAPERAPDDEDVRDGSSTTVAPVDAGSVPHDGRVSQEDLDHADELEPVTAALVRSRGPATDRGALMRALARNLR